MAASTILIVGDKSDAVREYETLVGMHIPDCDVRTCNNASQAINLAASRAVNGMIVDLSTSKAKGQEVCAQFKKSALTGNIPLMLISDDVDVQPDRKQGIVQEGADVCLTHPLDHEELINRIRVLLRIKHAEDGERAVKRRLQEVVAEHSAELRSSEERYRRLVEISPDIIAVCTDGIITFVNDAAMEILAATTAESVVGKPILELVEQRFVSEMEKILVDCGEKKEKIPFVVMKLLAIDNKVRDVEVAAVPFEYQDRQHIQFVIRDISERMQFSQRNRQSQRMEAVGQLAGGVAHDFNNILTTIRGYSELVLESLTSGDPLRDDMQEIRKATERAAALTRQLLAFSRRQVLEPKALDLNRVVIDIKRMLQRMIGEDVDLLTDLDSDVGVIKADRSQIEQVVMNLAVNARDAMPQGGTLTISTGNIDLGYDMESLRLDLNPGRYVSLEVSDTGVGMSQSTLFHIFEPFFTTKSKDKGTGLGLSTVYGIVKQSDGDIEVLSQEGRGTTFRIFLPIVPDSVAAMAPVQSETGALRGWETILLVEDEKSVRVLAKRMLERAGYTVLDASHGGEALLLCEKHDGPIHMILTDVVMPKMGGKELVERLVKNQPTMRTLLMSGYSDDGIVKMGEFLPNVSLLQKPFSYKELTAKIRQVLDE